MDGAHGVLLSIAGGSDLGLFEINEAASLVQEAAHEDANIIFGTVIDDSLGDEVRVTVIAAGFDSTPQIIAPDRRTGRTVVEAGPGDARPTGSNGPNGAPPYPAREPAGQGGYQQSAPAPYAPATPAAAPPASHPGYPPAQRQSRPIDDDDVDVPPFMKR